MPRRARFHTVVLALLVLATAGLVAWAVWTGWSYYTTPYAERPHHPDFRAYRPAGDVSHGLGILGSAMVLLLLLYSVRKRMRWLQRAGELGVWLRYHIFLGIAGPVLITLHTSFKVEGLVAVSYWSMVAVALSGFFGRYLYQQIPRNVLGEALGSDEMEALNEAILVELSGVHGADQKALDRLEQVATGWLERRSAPVGLLTLPVLNVILARQLQSWSVAYLGRKDEKAVQLGRKWALQARRLQLFHQIRDLFHYWHVFHKPFAVIMILVMIVHVAVAVALGYTWRFGG